jgi:hypothetical protein
MSLPWIVNTGSTSVRSLSDRRVHRARAECRVESKNVPDIRVNMSDHGGPPRPLAMPGQDGMGL